MRGTRKISDISKHVMFFRQIIISPAFYRESREMLFIRLCLIFRIIKTILPPIGRVRNRSGNKNTPSISVIFPLSKESFLHHVPIIIPENNISFLQRLLLPILIISLVLYVFPAGINKIFSPVQIHQFIIMFAFVITQINSPVHVKILSQLCCISRN